MVILISAWSTRSFQIRLPYRMTMLRTVSSSYQKKRNLWWNIKNQKNFLKSNKFLQKVSLSRRKSPESYITMFGKTSSLVMYWNYNLYGCIFIQLYNYYYFIYARLILVPIISGAEQTHHCLENIPSWKLLWKITQPMGYESECKTVIALYPSILYSSKQISGLILLTRENQCLALQYVHLRQIIYRI